jgi:VWFA-related protein
VLKPPVARDALIAALLVITAQAHGPQPQVFRTGTPLVSVDVVVHDKDGRPVADLTATDFNVFEDGKEQRIELFAIVGPRPTGSRGDASRTSSDGLLRATNRADSDPNVNATVILFDRLNTRFEDQVNARAEIVRFLSTIRPEDRVALYVLDSNKVRVLHDFTTDSASLVRAIARFRGATSAEQAATDERVPQPAFIGSAHEDAQMTAWLQEKTEMIATEFLRRRGQNTFAAFEAIAAHLAGLRGRKNLVWVSSAFPLVISEQFGPGTLSDEVSRAVRAVSTANISIYPVDTRGLVAPNSTPDATATQAVSGRQLAQRSTPGTMMTMMPNVDTMTELAARTGGRAFYNTNNIGRAIARAIDDARVTYVLGYTPSNDVWDGRFRTLKVSVRRPNIDVRHRSGYLAVPASVVKPGRLADIARAPLTANQIGLAVDVSKLDRASPNTRAVAIRVDPSGITLRKNGDVWDTALDIFIAHAQPDGELVTGLETTLNLRLTSDQRDQLLQEGFTMSRTVGLRDGAVRLHVVVRDKASSAAGSVIVPLAGSR